MAEARVACNQSPDLEQLTARSERAKAALAEASAVGVPTASELGSRLKTYDPDADLGVLEDAYVLAAESHFGQKRKSGLPYFSHPVAVAEILADLRLDQDALVTALLHDTVEDTSVSLDDVRARFGDRVADLVDGVTKLSQVSRARGSSSQAENLQKFVVAMANDVRVLLVKLADRLHNMRTLEHVPKLEKRERVARETLDIYAPLSRRIGVQRICGELEDLAFRWVNPAAFESINRRMDTERQLRRDAVAQVSSEITARLEEAGVTARVFGREKRAYSIWRKLERQHIDFDDLADIYAFRVIVETPEDCYRALGVAHALWRCVPERFKDFISTPKPNNYRSIHTTVLGPDNRRVELQIRTEEMELIAETGVAAHWRYKNASYGYDEESAQASGVNPLKHLQPLVEMIDHSIEPDEFLEHAKMEMVSDQVYAFTPKGDVIALPSGATPVDFAYAVHTNVGDTCVGVKINGRQRPLRSRLKNGDIVEILRSRRPAPPPDWDAIAVTGRARSAVRRLIRRSRREELAHVGRAIAEHAFKREGLDLAEANLTDALARLEYADEQEFFAEIGQGRLTTRGLLEAVFPGLESRTEDDAPRDLIGDEKARLYVQGHGLTEGIGLHFARCCTPLPGDRIVGILDKDAGVVVHAIDCERLEAFDHDEQDRWLDLRWTSEASNNAVSIGRVIATVQNVPGALADIATAVSRSSGNIVGLTINRREREFFEMVFDVEVQDTRHLSQIVASMRACAPVVTAERDRDGADDDVAVHEDDAA